MEHSTSDKDFLTTFAKGLNVIRSFEPNSMSMTLTEVAKKTICPEHQQDASY